LEGHSFEVDVWSLGVILYTMLVGKPPYESGNVKHTYVKIKHNNYKFPEDSGVSPYAKDLVQKMLVLNPVARLTLWEVT
jgi:serine/threonine protein kinase